VVRIFIEFTPLFFFLDGLFKVLSNLDPIDIKRELKIRGDDSNATYTNTKAVEKLAEMLDGDYTFSELEGLESQSREEIIGNLTNLGYEIPEDALITELVVILKEEGEKRERYLAELSEASKWEEEFGSNEEKMKSKEEKKEEEREEKKIRRRNKKKIGRTSTIPIIRKLDFLL